MQNTSASENTNHHTGADSGVTACPRCATTFRVSEQQLQLANGNVRCGSCLHVFQADPHGDSTANADSHADHGDEADPVEPAAADGDEHTVDSLEFSDAFLALDGNRTQPDSLTAAAQESESDGEEEDWARLILEQEESSSREPKNELLEAIMAAPAGAQEQPADEIPDTPEMQDYQQSEFKSTEGWMQELLGEQSKNEAPDEGFIPPAETADAAEPIGLGPEPDQDYVPEIFRTKKKLLDSIQADPLEMHLRRHISPRIRHSLNIIGILAAASLLLGQYAWFNAERLARNPDYRPFFTELCRYTGCVMPAENDISRIRNSNLVVLKHPRAEGGLLLDTIITNYADYEQPYPRLYVEFSDLQDQPVAAREFAPAEYLRGDLVGSTQMPVRRPVHLSLELADPGERAVNYKIRLLAP